MFASLSMLQEAMTPQPLVVHTFFLSTQSLLVHIYLHTAACSTYFFSLRTAALVVHVLLLYILYIIYSLL